jgi:hypothetical protein
VEVRTAGAGLGLGLGLELELEPEGSRKKSALAGLTEYAVLRFSNFNMGKTNAQCGLACFKG